MTREKEDWTKTSLRSILLLVFKSKVGIVMTGGGVFSPTLVRGLSRRL